MGWRQGADSRNSAIEEDDWLSDALLAAECLATPRTPSGGRGVTCQMVDEGFKTAKKQNPRDAAAASGAQALPESTPSRMMTRDEAACAPKTPMSAVAFRRRRDVLVKSIVDEFNATVFEGALPPDLEVVWSNFFSKTAGMTKFRMLQLPDDDDERFAGQAAERQAGAAGRGRGAGGRREARIEEGDILTASVELSSKVVDNAERLRCTLVHELCHVAQWVVNREAKPPHGDVFRQWAERVEAYDPSLRVTTCHNYDIAYRFMYKCCACGHQYGRHTRSIDVEMQACGECHGRLDLLETPKGKTRPPKAFAAFIQHHFHAAKRALTEPQAQDPPHAQVSLPDRVTQLSFTCRNCRGRRSSSCAHKVFTLCLSLPFMLLSPPRLPPSPHPSTLSVGLQVMSLLSQMWKIHKRNVEKGGADDPKDVDIESLAIDFVAGLSLQD